MNQASNLLELDIDSNQNLYDEALSSLTLDKTVITMWYHESEIIIPSKYYFYENAVAQKLTLLNTVQIVNKLNLEDEIKHFEERNHISFHEDQKNAIKNSINSGVSVITGGPGTGKTTIIKCIIEILKENNQKFMLLAPTGRAAKRMYDSTGEEAKTIHRALEVASGDLAKISRFVYNENNTFKTNVVIVDEVSMVDVALMNHLCKALPRDCKLILVGDKDQLPSVGAGNVLTDILNSGVIKISMLTKIFRQSDDSLIITNAHLINSGKMPLINNQSKDFFFEEKHELNDIKNSIVDMVVSRLPKFTGLESSQIQVLAPLKAGVCGIDNLNKSLQQNLNPPSITKMEIPVGDTIFRVGDKVMQTTNNYNLVWKKMNGFIEEEGEGVFNGDIGILKDIVHPPFSASGKTEIYVDFDGNVVKYLPKDLIKIKHGFAISIHKSQGGEFEFVIIPIIKNYNRMLYRKLVYTGITRAKKKLVLLGDPEALQIAASSNYGTERKTNLKNLIIECFE